MGMHLNIVDQVRTYGADLRVHQGELQVKGKGRLPPPLVAEINESRNEIVSILAKIVISEPAEQPSPQRKEKSCLPTLLIESPTAKETLPKKLSLKSMNIQSRKKSFRKACAWMLPRIDQLLAAGWNKNSLFKIGSLNYPLFWGLAWHEIWSISNRAELKHTGGIVFYIIPRVASRNQITQFVRPPLAKKQ